ncbi:protein transport protein SEC16B homolog [Juglans microcarpa x Juglans regia]|uniref:protein transport protein SEC16B homolog n=1 Tax=Juglans microcarpa x Juglans regia TaxID=2249226 RepID=UPI001B7E7B12|nr:protein transport protein SEC16B homolog [Juglans microcarpa x Juglans regia]XP_040985775.1 protein transport protein SEC16B homolog [Juglans microcarpa x Juglans regia]
MASNPPFQVEDQTDEDFFDKLVGDEFGPTTTGSNPQFTDGNDSDDAKAFSNLNIAEVGNAFGDLGGGGGGDDSMLEFEAKTEKDHVDGAAKSLGARAEERNSLVSSNSVGCDSIVESSNDGIGSEFTSDSTMSKSSGSGGSGVKEVGWNSFHAGSEQNSSKGFGSYSDFFNDLGGDSGTFQGDVGDNLNSQAKTVSAQEEYGADGTNNSVNYANYQESQVYGASMEQSTNMQDLNSSQSWENMYPGWKYDPNTGQWHQVDSNDTMATDVHHTGSDWGDVNDQKTDVSYLQHAAQPAVESVAETSTTESVSNWSQVCKGNNGYPEHMVFDPQYPGWYYDTIAQEWRALDTYTASIQSTAQAHDQQHQNGFVSNGSFHQNSNSLYGGYMQADNYEQGFGSQGPDGSWTGAYSNDYPQNLNAWPAETVPKSEAFATYGNDYQQHLNAWSAETVPENEAFSTLSRNQQLDNSYGSNSSLNINQQKSLNSFGTVSMYNGASQAHGKANGAVDFNNFIPDGNFSQQFNQANTKLDEQTQFSNNYFDSQKPPNLSHQSFESGHRTYAPNAGRSSAGRPPHALVTFGFGGKLIVMKDKSSLSSSSYGSQDPGGGSISIMNLMEVVMGNTDMSSCGLGASGYFRALCQQSFPGPLVGASVGSKELNKWIDERITSCESPDVDYRKGELLRLLLSLLKIACQHYGKLRSPFGADTVLRENDSPESAVAKLFASAKRNGTQFSEYGALSHSLQKLPSEGQIMATASEVQSFLVSGRKKEALQCAQEGQLWGPALVLASQLGDQYYVDTVKQMALRQLVAGSPLRTLCLLIAGQPAEVFSSGTTDPGLRGAVSMHQQPAQSGANFMLDDWEENLAVITANRTKDDELVLIHLGDCLWKERSEITAAHICYLVAEANFESYSDSARLCLIGADHWKCPRTYASPEAIQRTELYEYSKVLGNSQFILIPFQPYKLIYAHMLVEVGKVSDSLKYCQAVWKSLKTVRAPEVETWKQLVLSLEERIRAHQQGGYTANLAPTKLVGKLLNFFDSTAHRVVGGLPPPAPSVSQGSVPGNEHYPQPSGPRVSTSQSTMAISSLMPSASMEPISDWTADGNRMTMVNRSVSEPDFGRTPRQVDSSKDMTSSNDQGKASVGSSRFARFGFGSQLLQKTVGLVLRPRLGRQAKLGEKNKFYYDEKQKRWVEEGVELPAEEASFAPPPTTAAFQNGMSDYHLKSAMQKEGTPMNQSPYYKTPSEHNSGIPYGPSSSNQFSARGRMGVRSRYVDTFNQGGGSPANLFQSPSVPSVKPAVAANAKFFIPTPASSGEQTMEAIAENGQEDTATHEDPSTSTAYDSFQSPIPSSSMSMQRFPSMGSIPGKGVGTNGEASLPPNSRRTASWGGSFSDPFSPPNPAETKTLGEALGMPPSTYMPNESSLMRMPMNGGSVDDLHEVEL